MTVSQTATAVTPARGHRCPLCAAPAGAPCQPKPAADHLARFLDPATAGQLTRAYLSLALGELVPAAGCAVLTVPVPAVDLAALHDALSEATLAAFIASSGDDPECAREAVTAAAVAAAMAFQPGSPQAAAFGVVLAAITAGAR